MVYKQIALIGAGTIGRQFAGFFAAEGISVTLYDTDSKALPMAVKAARYGAKLRVKYGLSKQATVNKGFGRLRTTTDLKQAVKGADYIQEAVFEDIELKRKVLSEIERYASPKAIIATSTGGILPSRLEDALEHPERFLVVHPTVPFYSTRIVELVPCSKTDSHRVDEVRAFLESYGKLAIVLKKAREGYILNRLFFIMWREMLNLIADGVISPSDLDRVFCNYHVHWGIGIGPMLRTHLHGGSREAGGIASAIDYYNRVIPPIWKSVDGWTEIPEHVRTKVIAEIEAMPAVKKHAIREMIDYREDKLAWIYKTFPLRELDKFYR